MCVSFTLFRISGTEFVAFPGALTTQACGGRSWNLHLLSTIDQTLLDGRDALFLFHSLFDPGDLRLLELACRVFSCSAWHRVWDRYWRCKEDEADLIVCFDIEFDLFAGEGANPALVSIVIAMEGRHKLD